MVTLKAVLCGMRVDREGETKLTLEIPLSQLAEATKLCGMVQQVMQVTLTPVQSGVIGGKAVEDDEDVGI